MIHGASTRRAHAAFGAAPGLLARLAGLVALLVGVLAPTATQAAPALLSARLPTSGPTLSVNDRLADRRYVAAGTRAYEVGSEDGRFPASGWHIHGEMGGIWTPPLKLLDGIWFAINGQWLGPATSFESGYGYVGMALPGTSRHVQVRRVDFAPDDRRAVLIGLQFTVPDDSRPDNGDRGDHLTLTMDAHSELLKAYPWGSTNPSQTDYNLPDLAAFNGRQLVFSEDGQSPGEATPHHWAALVGSTLTPTGGAAATCAAAAACHRGPQDPPVVCPASGTDPYRCDDSTFGKGAGGQLTFDVRLDGQSSPTVWFVVAGSDRGLAEAQAEYAAAAADPAAALQAKIVERKRLAGYTRLTLPGDPLLARSIDWGKQNLADLRQQARALQLRATKEGTSYPPPVGTLPRIDFVGAGFPDYPWLFATDGEYTAFADVALGQFGAVEAHLRALRDVSEILNSGSGKVVHEVVTDGSVYHGANGDIGNTDETVKFPSAVALVWRWTGDRAFLDEMYDFTRRTMRYAFSLDGPDMDNWLAGPGNVERAGMGAEKLDVAVYTIRGLLDLAEMAHAQGDAATQHWADSKAAQMTRAFEQAWWLARAGTPSYADSLADPTVSPDDPSAALAPVENTQLYQRHWIGVTPMEAELWQAGYALPGLSIPAHANPALSLRETSCFSNPNGLFHTGTAGCDTSATSPSDRAIFSLGNAVMAVAEGNYGRLGPMQQQRYTSANQRVQLPTPDEQPGALPEILPSPDYVRSIDQPFTARAMVMQAWGFYGTAWPVVHQQLGVSPDLGNGLVAVVPQVPPQHRAEPISGADILLGSGSIDVTAAADRNTYRTVVAVHLSARLIIGHTIPFDARPRSVTLNGRRAPYTIRTTNRGLEVLVDAGTSGGTQTLAVITD